MSSYDRALELAAKLTADGIAATVDTRSATPPCVLITPPRRAYDVGCGYSATWALWVLAPGTANADAHRQLDELADRVAGVLDVIRAEPGTYALSADSPPLPAYRLDMEEVI